MRIPEHDLFIETVQTQVKEALALVGPDRATDSASTFNISFATLYKISRWRPEHDTSFNLRKLIDCYDWACNVLDTTPTNKLQTTEPSSRGFTPDQGPRAKSP